MKSMLDKIGVGKRKKIRQLRSEQKNSSKPRFNNPYFPNQKKNKEIKKEKDDGWAYFGILALLIGSISYLVFGTNFFLIQNVNISGNNKISQERIQAAANEYLEAKKLFIIPQNNWVFFSSNKAQRLINEKISDSFALESLAVDKKWPNLVEIVVKERISGLTWVTNEKYYYVDLEGVISQTIANKDDAEVDLPLVFDNNNAIVEINEQVISKELLAFILNLVEELPNHGIDIESYSIPQTTCQEQQYKAEKIIADDIAETEDEETKERKKEILEQYNQGEITVDESLALLENVKKEKQEVMSVNNKGEEFIEWESIFVPKECDFGKINSEIHVKTDEGYVIYFDANIELAQQLNNLNSTLNQKIDNPENLQYIDLRFEDRIYYK